MATLTKRAQGTFCWPELMTSDQAGAKQYYSSLFGWTVKDIPIPNSGPYTTFQLNGRDVAAAFTLPAEMRKQGVPPYWGAYISVDDADQAVKKAKELGATVLMEPMDVMDGLGRMAALQDPTGAHVSVWQAGTHIGAQALDEVGALCWTELMTRDTAKAKAFYSALIGWKTEEMPMGPMPYTLYKRVDGVNAGGMMAIPADMPQVPPHWLSYIQVENVGKTIERSTSLGGKTLVPAMMVPGVGEFAVLQDPQGAAFGVFKFTK
jgi:predicted enzyme related to lactoylglutathione lyase